MPEIFMWKVLPAHNNQRNDWNLLLFLFKYLISKFVHLILIIFPKKAEAGVVTEVDCLVIGWQGPWHLFNVGKLLIFAEWCVKINDGL